jgi:hypothetical protein
MLPILHHLPLPGGQISRAKPLPVHGCGLCDRRVLAMGLTPQRGLAVSVETVTYPYETVVAGAASNEAAPLDLTIIDGDPCGANAADQLLLRVGLSGPAQLMLSQAKCAVAPPVE